MSKAKDRARAESGLIFRDGHLVQKEEWYKAHPTKEMLKEQQAKVDEALKAELAGKFSKPTKEVIEAAGPPPFDYNCSKCGRKHKAGTKIHDQHKLFAVDIEEF